MPQANTASSEPASYRPKLRDVEVKARCTDSYKSNSGGGCNIADERVQDCLKLTDYGTHQNKYKIIKYNYTCSFEQVTICVFLNKLQFVYF